MKYFVKKVNAEHFFYYMKLNILPFTAQINLSARKT